MQSSVTSSLTLNKLKKEKHMHSSVSSVHRKHNRIHLNSYRRKTIHLNIFKGPRLDVTDTIGEEK